MQAIQMDVEAVATGQAIAFLAVDSSWGHWLGSRPVPGLTSSLHLVI